MGEEENDIAKLRESRNLLGQAVFLSKLLQSYVVTDRDLGQMVTQVSDCHLQHYINKIRELVVNYTTSNIGVAAKMF